MLISNARYPMITYLSMDKENVTEKFPMGAETMAAKRFLEQSKATKEFFGTVGAMNSFNSACQHKYYTVPEYLYKKMDNNDGFRSLYFTEGLKSCSKFTNASILLPGGGHYAYLILGFELANNIKGQKQPYIAVCLMKGDVFIGFEEAFLLPGEQLDIPPTGYYPEGVEPNTFLSFIMIFHGYVAKKASIKELEKKNNYTSQMIYQIN